MHETIVEMARDIGGAIQEAFAGVETTVAIGGSQVMLAYYARFPNAIEMNGLTDREIARRPLQQRGWVGHEKGIALWDTYLIQRKTNMLFGVTHYLPVPDDRIGALRNLQVFVPDLVVPPGKIPGVEGRLDWVKATMIVYDADVMTPLIGRDNVRFTPFEHHLDDYIVKKMPHLDVAEVRKDYAAFRRFYFDHNEDPRRQEAIEQFLRR